MKTALILSLLVSTFAHAATPALYCVSTKTFTDSKSWPVNQINIFTTAKGTLMMNLQFHAWGQSEEEDANVTTGKLLTLRNLSFDSATQTLSNTNGKFALKLGKQISPKTAENILAKKKTSFDFINPAGMQVEFKKYRLATMTAYDYDGQPNKWSSTLKAAFAAGVTEYICGDAKNIDHKAMEAFRKAARDSD